MIEKAQKEIKDLNQQTLFQIAEIKKRYIDKTVERSSKIRKRFAKNYTNYLNQSLSSTLLKGKETVLKLKNKLINELKTKLNSLISEKINKHYANYIIYLINSMKSVKPNIKRHQEIELLLNSKDYDYFLKNYSKIENSFEVPVEIHEDQKDFIGGFKVILGGGLISYDYTIENLINKNSVYIQMEISKIIENIEIKSIENKFDNLIQVQKHKITEVLRIYDQIQI
jgi:vacuolar-type H+-ATPase subunit E/Vma4